MLVLLSIHTQTSTARNSVGYVRFLSMTMNVLAVKSNIFSCAISERRLCNVVKHSVEYVFSPS